MSKLFKTISVLIILLLFFMPVFVQATDVNMNLTTPDANNIAAPNDNTALTNTDTQTSSDVLSPESTYSNAAPTISNLNDSNDSGLGIGSILNIILIVVGVLLILLGIAIIIRLKR